MHQWFMLSTAKSTWFKHREWRSSNFDHFHKNDVTSNKKSHYMLSHEESYQYLLILNTESFFVFVDILPNISQVNKGNK